MCAESWVKQKDRMTSKLSSYALRLQVVRSEVGWQREYLNGDWEERIHREWNESSSHCWNILAISATSRPINYFGFFGPFDTFLGSDIPDLTPPPSLSEKLFFKSVYFCFYVLRVVNSSPNARSWLRPEKWSKWHRYWYWYTNSNTDTGKDQFLDPSGYSLYWCFLFNLFHEKFFGDFFGHFSEHCKFLILVW